jgi:hypothetical protein
MNRITVSRDLFARFAQWALVQNDPALFAGAESWTDAPASDCRRGHAALMKGGDRYNQIGLEAFRRFQQDRTGEYTFIRTR